MSAATDPLAAVKRATRQRGRQQAKLEEVQQDWQAALYAAAQTEITWTDIAAQAGVSRQYVVRMVTEYATGASLPVPREPRD